MYARKNACLLIRYVQSIYFKQGDVYRGHKHDPVISTKRSYNKHASIASQQNNDAHLQAVAIATLVPVVRDWLALQQWDEEKGHAANYGAHRSFVCNPRVNSLGNDSEEEPCKWDFWSYHCDAEEEVAKPPVLKVLLK